jgi:hypothetical protein
MAGEAERAVTARLGTIEDQVDKTLQYAGARRGALRCEDPFNREVEQRICHKTALVRRDLANDIVNPICDQSHDGLEFFDVGMRWCLVARRGHRQI